MTRYTFSPLLNAYWHKDNWSIKQEQCHCNYRNRQSELFFRGQLLFLLAVYRNMVIPSSSAALYPHPSQAESLRQRKCISWCDLIEFLLLPMMSCLWNLPHLSLFLLYFPLFPPPPAFSPLQKATLLWVVDEDMVAESSRIISSQERDILSPNSNIWILLGVLLALVWVTCHMSPLARSKMISWLARLDPICGQTSMSWGEAAPSCKKVLLPDEGMQDWGD